MNEAFSDSTTGARSRPAVAISRVCCAGKKLQADTPQTATVSTTGRRAVAGGNRAAQSDKVAKAATNRARLHVMTGRTPTRSVASKKV